MTPTVAEVRAVEGPVQALAHAVNAVASDFVSDLGPSTSASMPPALAPRPANIIITGADDTSVEAEAAAAPSLSDGPPEVCTVCKTSQVWQTIHHTATMFRTSLGSVHSKQ